MTGSPADREINIDNLRGSCDALIATSSDPGAARAVLVRMWALGASGTSHLLADLADLAAAHAERTGQEPTVAELLEAAGRPQAAADFRHALAQGLRAHERTAAERLQRAVAQRAQEAGRALLRIYQTHEARRQTPQQTGQHAA